MSRVVVFDFDGTVCLGDDVVLAYADALDAVHGGHETREATLRFLQHGPAETGPEDGYGFVAATAVARSDPAARAAAYRSSRAALHAGAIRAHAPAGLAALLDARRGVALLATNAPRDGLDPLLARLGLAGRFDDVIGDAGKPDGLPAVLRAAMRRFGADPHEVLSVGDVWRNDLAPAAALGCATALVDRFGVRRGAPDHAAPALQGLYPVIRDWWAC